MASPRNIGAVARKIEEEQSFSRPKQFARDQEPSLGQEASVAKERTNVIDASDRFAARRQAAEQARQNNPSQEAQQNLQAQQAQEEERARQQEEQAKRQEEEKAWKKEADLKGQVEEAKVGVSRAEGEAKITEERAVDLNQKAEVDPLAVQEEARKARGQKKQEPERASTHQQAEKTEEKEPEVSQSNQADVAKAKEAINKGEEAKVIAPDHAKELHQEAAKDPNKAREAAEQAGQQAQGGVVEAVGAKFGDVAEKTGGKIGNARQEAKEKEAAQGQDKAPEAQLTQEVAQQKAPEQAKDQKTPEPEKAKAQQPAEAKAEDKQKAPEQAQQAGGPDKEIRARVDELRGKGDINQAEATRLHNQIDNGNGAVVREATTIQSDLGDNGSRDSIRKNLKPVLSDNNSDTVSQIKEREAKIARGEDPDAKPEQAKAQAQAQAPEDDLLKPMSLDKVQVGRAAQDSAHDLERAQNDNGIDSSRIFANAQKFGTSVQKGAGKDQKPEKEALAA